jgi:hypothetical protein
MRVKHESCQRIINGLITVVPDHGQQIESRQDGIRQVHIIIEVQVALVNTTDGISCCDDGTSSVQ